MTSPTKPAVIALVLCALAYLAAAPALISGSDSDASMTLLGVGVVALGFSRWWPHSESLASGAGPSR